MSSDIASIVGDLYGRLCCELREDDSFLAKDSDSKLPDLVISDLVTYIELLEGWSAKMDLISPCTTTQLIERHVIDSLAMCKMWRIIASGLQLESGLCIDIGSGAGLPGIVFAILYRSQRVVLCEPRKKRSHFLLEVRRKLNLENVEIANYEMRALVDFFRGKANLVTSRALGQEKLFLTTAAALLIANGHVIQMVGPNWKCAHTANELLSLGLSFKATEHYRLPITGAAHALAICTRSQPTILAGS